MHPYAKRSQCNDQKVSLQEVIWKFLLRILNSKLFSKLAYDFKHTTNLRDRSAIAVTCCVIIHCLEISCKDDQTTSAQRE